MKEFLESQGFYIGYKIINKDGDSIRIEDLLNDFLINNKQKNINETFSKCTCLRPQTNCFSGKCSYCNKTIQKDITTDDL